MKMSAISEGIGGVGSMLTGGLLGGGGGGRRGGGSGQGGGGITKYMRANEDGSVTRSMHGPIPQAVPDKHGYFDYRKDPYFNSFH